MSSKNVTLRLNDVNLCNFKERVCSEVIVYLKPISYLGDLDPVSGLLKDVGSISGRILVYPGAVGSTVGSYILYGLRTNNVSPLALITWNLDPVTIIGAILAQIPLCTLREVKEIFSMLRNREGSVFRFRGCLEDRVLYIEGEVNSI